MSVVEQDSLFLTLLLPELRGLIRLALPVTIWSTKYRVFLRRTCRQLRHEDPADLFPSAWAPDGRITYEGLKVDRAHMTSLYLFIIILARDMPTPAWPAPSRILLTRANLEIPRVPPVLETMRTQRLALSMIWDIGATRVNLRYDPMNGWELTATTDNYPIKADPFHTFAWLVHSDHCASITARWRA